MSKENVEHALSEIACTSGRNLLVVERVFHLMLDVNSFGHVLIIADGALTDVAMPDSLGHLPSSLRDDVNASYDDVIFLHDQIMRHLVRAGREQAEVQR